MDASRAEMDLENKKLRSQINSLETELKKIRRTIQEIIDENETLRRDLQRTAQERHQPFSLTHMNNDSLIEIQRKQLELLEQEKNDMNQLFEDSQEIIRQLQEEVNDLKSPLKPHFLKLEMHTKQTQEEHAQVEAALMQEIKVIHEELTKRSQELVKSQLRLKEVERQNENLQIEVQQKQEDLRRYLKKDLTHDGTLVAFQTAMDDLEVKFQQSLKEKDVALRQRDELDLKLRNLQQEHLELQEKFSETIGHFQQHQQMAVPIEEENDLEQSRFEHERMHRTIDELIEQAAMKTRDAVEEVRQQYNDNLEKIMQEYNRLEMELNQKQLDFDKCLRAKRSVDEELDKILQERRLNLEKSTLDHDDLAKRCFTAERERDETQLKLEQLQQTHKLLQQTYDAEKANHEIKRHELTERAQKVTHDLDKMTAEFTINFNELNELKKRFSSLQNEQTALHRRMTDSVKRHEEQMLGKEKECLDRLNQRDQVNRTTFNELRNLVNRQQRMIVKYKEECHTIASQCETKISEYKQKIEHLRTRNEQLQSDMADLQRKDAEMNRILAKNSNRIKSLEQRLQDTEEQAIEASRRVAKQLVRDRLALVPTDHYAYSTMRPHHSHSLFNLTSSSPPVVSSTTPIDSIERLSNGK